MNFDLARRILREVEQCADGSLPLRGRRMVHEAQLMEEEGWVRLSEHSGHGARAVARLTEAGKRVSSLFRDDAVAQRLRDAFSRPAASS
ncbi:MAG: hypothetical protein H0T83_09945 [Chthoniobacterales bacterium]|nr:hypothetical protein [Chthoniobacterales bacterium]